MKMSFEKNFAAALADRPVMVCKVEQMLIQLQHIEQVGIQAGVQTFYDMESSIAGGHIIGFVYDIRVREVPYMIVNRRSYYKADCRI
jgi:hypothetical protein